MYDFLQIKADDSDFVWEPCDTDEKLERKANSWHDNRVLYQFKYWHGTALTSSGIQLKKRQQYNCVDGIPTFSEISESHREKLTECYHRCVPVYNFLENCQKNK